MKISRNPLLVLMAVVVLSFTGACGPEEASAPPGKQTAAKAAPEDGEPPIWTQPSQEGSTQEEPTSTGPTEARPTSTAGDGKLKVQRRKKYTNIDCTTLLSPADVEAAVGVAGNPPKMVGSKGNACLAGSSLGDSAGATVNYSTSNKNIITTGEPFEISGNSAFRKLASDNRTCTVDVALDEKGDFSLGAGLQVEVGMLTQDKDPCEAAAKLAEKAFGKIPDA
ncbi:hypothetical protein [Kibdelosporangium phytohabitans]|uniref:DUF3558 domain-containing protein n=1 Tax=Kibdelosporangium phytohabitans TaxID=860235 RepID=A0A0N9I174_9PSEU|nr:hypothetical protein [Kibdelosporangium phytohabitans]ALG12115.1 hypothetical protein AOZ06_39300 [Kibdelosporangium phytohabitans]MBE1463614.1 hypothetical protein [Kibdelosporangium phytohabitans]